MFFHPYLLSVFGFGFNGTYTSGADWVGPIIIGSNIIFYEWPEKHVSLGASMVALSVVFLLFSLYVMVSYDTLLAFRLFGLLAISGSIISLIGAMKTLRWKMPTGA